MRILDKLFSRKPTKTSRYPSAGEIQAQKIKSVMGMVAARQLEQPAEALKFRHLLGLSFRGFSIVPASLPVSLTRGSLRDIDPWWHADSVRRTFSEAELTEDRRVGNTDRYLIRTETRDVVTLDGQKFQTIRKVFYDKKQALHFKELFVQDESGRVFPYNQLPVHLMRLDGIDLVNIQPEKDIVVTEGYPAAEALRKRGVDAVGITTGTFVFPSERALSPLLKAKHIVLWPDNDSAGAHLMSGVARALSKMGARPGQIRLVFWRGGPRKGDAYDFAGSDEELRTVLAQATDWSPELRFATNIVKSLFVRYISPQLRLADQVQPPKPEIMRERSVSVTEAVISGIARKLANDEPLSGREKELLDSLASRNAESEGSSNDH